MSKGAAKLRHLLFEDRLHIMPCCFDGLSAKLIEQAGFSMTFMSGFAVSASRLGLPDTGLISFGEMLDQGRSICGTVSIPVLGDGDTGYGNAMNVKRTVREYERAGFACIMIEDQVSPKRCGHVKGKQVVDRRDALIRMRSAIDARDQGEDILIMARTDARATHGFDEALYRCQAFADLGADILFMEAPESVAEMETFCRQVTGTKMANMLEQGKTPILPPDDLAAMGYSIAAYPLTLLGVAVGAMQEALQRLRRGEHDEKMVDFEDLKKVVGFPEYYREQGDY